MRIFHHNVPKAFSLVELLITFVLLALMGALLVPQYLKLQRQTNVQIAAQQCDNLHKAILSWMNSYPDVQTISTRYDYFQNPPSGFICPGYFCSTINGVASYLDPSLTPIIPTTITTTPRTGNLVAVLSGSGLNQYVSCFYTPVMEQITGSTLPTTNPASVTIGGVSYPVPAATNAPMVNGMYTAYGVIFWPTGPTVRRNTQPIVALFLPN